MANFISIPEDIEHSYWHSGTNSVVYHGFGLAPDGTDTAHLLVRASFNGVLANYYESFPYPSLDVNNYWMAAFVKTPTTYPEGATPSTIVLLSMYQSQLSMYLNLVTGEYGKAAGGEGIADIFAEQYPAGWWRIGMRITPSFTNVKQVLLLSDWMEPEGGCLLLWGGQLESDAGLIRPEYTAVSGWQSNTSYKYSRNFAK